MERLREKRENSIAIALLDGFNQDMSQLLVHFEEIEIIPGLHDLSFPEANHRQPCEGYFPGVGAPGSYMAIHGGVFLVVRERVDLHVDGGKVLFEIPVKIKKVFGSSGSARGIEPMNDHVAVELFRDVVFVGLVPDLVVPLLD